MESATTGLAAGHDDDFGAMENDTLPDFTQLEHFINGDNEEQNDYFADTLANQEASRHSGPLATSDVGLVESSTLMATQRPVQSLSRMYNNGGSGHVSTILAPLPNTAARGSVSLGQQYDPRNTAPHHCNSYSVVHTLPDSPPDSVSEPPYSSPEATRSGSSVGGSPLNDGHSSSGSGQRYLMQSVNSNDVYGSLFGATLDLNNDLMSPNVTYSPVPMPQQQHQTVQSIPPILPTPLVRNNSSTQIPTQPQPLPQISEECMSSTKTPTIYTIEDHGGGNPLISLSGSACSLGPTTDSPSSSSAGPKKRKLSQTETLPVNPVAPATFVTSNKNMNVKQEPQLSPTANTNPHQGVVGADEDYSYEFSADVSMFNDTYQCIRFQPFQQSTWHPLFDRNLKELPSPNFRVDADKGFNFSSTDDAFVCQKKNHFQITCHVQQSGEPYYVKTVEGLKKVERFYLHFFGVKVEAPTQLIRVEQSQSDRSKKPFHPVLVELRQDQVSKITVGRLHFNETTANNMRKKGKPNPDQRFFNLAVGLQAHCADTTLTIVAHCSERIIVRASNPGMFENEVETTWQKGATSESVYHAGRVGINTDHPDEALVVHGNVRITGHLVQPSDMRAKEGIEEADTKEQLRNVQALRVVHYKYTEQFAETAGLNEDERADTGVIAQELKVIIPDAVRPAGNIVLPDGRQIENFLVVNKERIFMENVGAVKELCKVTDNLENRIDELERMNRKLAKLKRLDSIRSASNGSTGSVASSAACMARRRTPCTNSNQKTICSNRYVQAIVATLVMIMTFCLIAMATLYILDWQKRNPDNFTDEFSIRNGNTEHDATLNLTLSASSLQDWSDSTSAWNRTSNTADTSASSPGTNSTIATSFHLSQSVVSSGRPNGYLDVNSSSSGDARVRTFTSLRSLPPEPVGKPETCPTTPCQIYCCVANPTGHGQSTAQISALAMSSQRLLSESTTGFSASSNSAPASPPSELFTNNVDNFSKGNKDREIRGPSAPVGPGYWAKPRENTPWNRYVRHLSSHRDLGLRRGPSSDDISLHGTHTPPNVKASSTVQVTAWDGSFITILGSNRFNVTLGSSYCMFGSDEYIRCLNGNAANYTYLIPLSKYMPDPSLTLRFHFQTFAPPNVCSSPVREGACPNGQTNGAPTNRDFETRNDGRDSVFRNLHVNVGRSSVMAYRIRFPVVRGETIDLCEKPSSSLRDKFVEYNLVFYRECNDMQ